MRSRSLILLTVSMTGFVVSSGTLMFASTDRYEKLAPYRAIRWREAGDEWAAEVEIDGRWTRLLKIDSRPVADIVAFSQKTVPDNWQKRFSEDLVEVLTLMKHPPGPTVDLTLQDLKTATIRVLQDVPMTRENRQAIWRARNQRRPPRPGRGDRGRTPIAFEKTLESLRKRHGLPALGAAVVEGDDLRAIGATGVRAAGKPERVTVDDLWHLGSCTKAMTATLIARLVQQGVLDWNEPIDKPFRRMRKQMHASYRKVTLLQLLSNRGGTPASLLKDKNLWSVLRTRRGPPDAARVFLARKVLARAPEVEPGSQFVYSNAGFAIAAAAAEAKTGKAWETLIRERVFKPLKIKSAGFGAPGSARKIDAPRGHVRDGERFQPVPPGPDADNPPAIFPAGGVHMTLADWARFAAFHLKVARGGKVDLLKKEVAADLHKTHFGGDYALGWMTVADPAGGQRMLTHAGSNTMWYAVIWIVPRLNRAVLVTTNCYDEKVSKACDELVAELLRADFERD